MQIFRNELGEAHRENDLLMRFVLRSDKTSLESVFCNHFSNVRWREWIHSNKDQENSYSDRFHEQKDESSKMPRSRSNLSPDDTVINAENSHLFLVKISTEIKPTGYGDCNTSSPVVWDR